MRNNNFTENSANVREVDSLDVPVSMEGADIRSLMAFIHKQIEIYAALLELETQKRNAIFQLNARMLKDATSMEEIRLQELRENESFLDTRLALLQEKYHLSARMTLTGILSAMPDAEAGKLRRQREDLLQMLHRLKSANKTNSLLLEENREFFHHLMENLSLQSDPDYDKKGNENVSRKSIFINVTG